jgi:Lar family restriction alleviation protein
MEIDIKSCPFCGSDEITLGPVRRYCFAVKCSECTGGIIGKSERFALSRWNKRAEPKDAGFFTLEEDGGKNGEA